jgi:4-alpha-glucanotransferase
MRYAGAVRIDHVMGLKRLYLIPRGASPADGAYVRYPLEGLLAAVAEESNSARCVVIGEDLGTVPEELRVALARRGIWRYLVMLFERDESGAFLAPGRYPADALATFTTHDLPTFAGWMSGRDLEMKHAIGVDPGESAEARGRAREALRTALSTQAAGDDFAAVAQYLAHTPSRLVMVALEDILGVAEQINIPGTVSQHPNWRRRIPLPLERLKDCNELRRIAKVFAQAGRASSS